MLKNAPFRFFHSFRSIKGRGWSGWGVLLEDTWMRLLHQHQTLSEGKGEEHEGEEKPVLPNGSSRGLSSDPILCWHSAHQTSLGENLLLTANFSWRKDQDFRFLTWITLWIRLFCSEYPVHQPYKETEQHERDLNGRVCIKQDWHKQECTCILHSKKYTCSHHPDVQPNVWLETVGSFPDTKTTGNINAQFTQKVDKFNGYILACLWHCSHPEKEDKVKINGRHRTVCWTCLPRSVSDVSRRTFFARDQHQHPSHHQAAHQLCRATQ